MQTFNPPHDLDQLGVGLGLYMYGICTNLGPFKAHLHRRAVTVYRAVGKIERAVFYGDVYTWSGRAARLNGKPLGLETRAIFPKYRSGTAHTDQSLSLGRQSSCQDKK